MADWSLLETVIYSVGNVAIGLLLIFLVIKTHKNVPKVR
jgi:hypothetical protein